METRKLIETRTKEIIDMCQKMGFSDSESESESESESTGTILDYEHYSKKSDISQNNTVDDDNNDFDEDEWETIVFEDLSMNDDQMNSKFKKD